MVGVRPFAIFVIYPRFCDNLRRSTRLFADDSSIIASPPYIRILEDIVNTDLVNLSDLESSCFATFNPNKTENRPFICHPNIIFDGEHPNAVDYHKHLDFCSARMLNGIFKLIILSSDVQN